MKPWQAARSAFSAAVLIGLAVSPSPAHAASVAQGQKLAQQLCSQCHVVTHSGKSGWTNAPRFDAIAADPKNTAASLQAFIEKPHMKMLNLQRKPSEAADLAAYILSLQR